MTASVSVRVRVRVRVMAVGGTSGKPFTAWLHPLQNAILRVMIQVFVQNARRTRDRRSQ